MSSPSATHSPTDAARGTWRIAVTGSHGLIGSALVSALAAAGHAVHRVVRPGGRAAHPEHDLAAGAPIVWDPAAGRIDARALDGMDAAVHLAGEPVAERWTAEHKRGILESRMRGTRLLAEAIAGLERPPRVLVSASAIGYYGDGGDRLLDESSPAGRDFLAGVAREWEAAARPAAESGVRVVHPRFGVVLSPAGGALAALLPPFKLGAGGKLGSGKQWMSWVSLTDTIRALQHLLVTDALAGPVNVVAPHPVTNADFARTLGHVLGRPAVVPVPAFVVKAMLGEMAEVMLLAGQRLRPDRLLETGFAFRHPTLEEALRFELGR